MNRQKLGAFRVVKIHICINLCTLEGHLTNCGLWVVMGSWRLLSVANGPLGHWGEGRKALWRAHWKSLHLPPSFFCETKTALRA